MNSARRSVIIALVAIWLVAAIGALATFAYMTHVARSQLWPQLAVPARVEAMLEANQLAQLRLRADQLARDPAFVAYIAQSLIPDPARGNTIDKASITDLLSARRKGYDLAMVLEPDGSPVARSGRLFNGETHIRNDPAVQRAIATLRAQQELRVEQGQIMLAVVEPLLRAGALQGVLYTAKHLGQAFVTSISQVAGTDVALVTSAPTQSAQRLLHSDFSPAIAQAIHVRLASIAEPTAGHLRHFSVRVDGRHLPFSASRLHAAGAQATLVALDSKFSAASKAATLAWPLWLGMALVGLIASGAALLRWRRTDAPLERLCSIVEHAAHGDHKLVVRTQGSATLRRLRDAINPLINQPAKPVGSRETDRSK